MRGPARIVEGPSQPGGIFMPLHFDSGKHFHNAGATAQALLYLPYARQGMTYELTDVAGVTFRAVAQASDTIRICTQTTPLGGHVTSCVGGSFKLTCTRTGHWVCTRLVGSLQTT